MTFDELLEMLDIDEASEFEYFENMADLAESDEDIDAEIIYRLFKDADMNVMADLFKDYFDDILESVPEDAMEVYTLLDSVKMSLIGMSKNIEEETDTVRLSDQFARFREWYSISSQVWIREIGALEGDKCVCMRDALTCSRVENFGGEKYEYTFDEALDLEIDEYTMSFADLAREEQLEYDPQLDELADMDDPDLDYVDQIFTPDDKMN